MLLKLKNAAQEKSTIPYNTIYIDSSNLRSFDELELDIQRRISPRDYYKKTHHNFSFYDIIFRFASVQKKKIMLLIDEADSIVSKSSVSDSNKFFNAIRSLSNESKIKFVIAGFRNIFNLISDPTHPLYNLCEGVKLGMLDKQEVRHLITVPLHNLNIKLIEEEIIIKQINNFSGGHPSLVQFIGKKMFESRKRNIIDIGIVENALNSNEILDFVRDSFIVNTTPIEKFLCILVRKEEAFTIEDVFDKLLYEGLSINSDYQKIYQFLSNLTLYNIIERNKDKYRFVYPQLQKKILEDFSSQEFIKYLKEDIADEDTETIKLISGIEKSIIRDRDKDIAIEANLDIIMRAVHNIRNPAEIIHTMIEVLKRDYKIDNGVANIINKIERQIIRIEELVYDFNRYIKPFEKRIKKIDIVDIIKDITNRFIQSNENIDIKSEFEIIGHKIEADEDGIKWAIEEIVKNAIKNKAHRIKIKLNSNFNRVKIHFEDDGVGIDEKYSQRIFDPFFTTDPTSTGLGLAVIRKIIEEHKGIIEFKKSISLNSCFIIDIPIEQ